MDVHMEWQFINIRCDEPANIISDVIMSAMASQITGILIVCSTVCSDTDQRKHQSSTPLAFVREIHPWPVVSPHKRQITRKMFPLDYVIMIRPETCALIPSQRASNAENVSTWLRQNDSTLNLCVLFILRVEWGMAPVEDNHHLVRWQVSGTPLALCLL